VTFGTWVAFGLALIVFVLWKLATGLLYWTAVVIAAGSIHVYRFTTRFIRGETHGVLSS